MSEKYTTKTASLKATRADVQKLDAKKMLLNGKNILDYIEENKTTVLDERRTNVTPYDLWGTRVETAEDGTVTILHELIDASVDKYAEVNEGWNLPYGLHEQEGMFHFPGGADWFRELVLPYDSSREDYKWTLIDNKLYKDGEFVANIQTNMIEKGEGMFGGAEDEHIARLFEFNSDLSNLTDGDYMFKNCRKLTSFTSDLPNLTNGVCMFLYCTEFTSFSLDLSSLINGDSMFYYCPILTTFTSNLSNLTNGYCMFNYCFGLTTFVSDLSSLTNGYWMFSDCKLDTESLMHIAESIKDVNGLTNDDNHYDGGVYKTIHIGIGNTTPTEEEKGLLTEIHNKGWQVYVNGSNDSNIFNPAAVIPEEGEGEMPQIIPFYAKPVESDEEHAEYVGEDGKYYNILGGQFIFVDDPETYGMFVSLEDAAANMRLTKIEKKINQN